MHVCKAYAGDCAARLLSFESWSTLLILHSTHPGNSYPEAQAVAAVCHVIASR